VYNFFLSFEPSRRRLKGVCILLSVATLAMLLSYCVELKHSNEEILCLALNIYHEGRGEPFAGRLGIATVTMNRVASKKFPNNVCQVVFQRRYHRKHGFYVGEFSWTQDQISDTPKHDASWTDAINLARNVYRNNLLNHDVKNALFYHATYIQPGWANRMHKITTIGQHAFYQNYGTVSNKPEKK